MRRSRTCFLSVLFSIFMLWATAVPPKAQNSTQWIVLGADASASFAANLSALDGGSGRMSSGLTTMQIINGRTVAAIDPILDGLLQRVIHTAHHRCGGYTVHPTLEAAEAEARNPYYEPGAVDRLTVFPGTIDQQTIVRPTLALVDKSQMVATVLKLQDFGTRYFEHVNGQKAALELKLLWESYGSGRTDFSVRLQTHNFLQNSVIATIRGTEIPDEIVVIGAHLDTINTFNLDAAPGADDDASGIAAVSEVLRVILASDFRPKRTLQFMAYAAEEVGLRGSKDIAKIYSDQGTRMIAALQLDMTGFGGSSEDMYFVTDFVSADLTAFLKELIGEYNGLGQHHITYGETKCGYACSDHSAWTGKGFRSAFPFESRFEDYNKKIHTENDRLDHIDMTGARQAKFAKLGVEFMMELGKNSPPPSKK